MAVSVVVPLYNKASHVARAVASVLGQTAPDFELVVVDDGSTDGGGDIVRQFRDPRIRLVQQENHGVSAARNRGIRESLHDHIAFLDADDEWTSVFLETVLALSSRYPAAGLYATAYSYSTGRAVWRPSFIECVDTPEGGILRDYFRAALGPTPVSASAAMIPRWVFDEVGDFPAGVGRGEDLHMWMRIALRHPVAWSPVEGAVYHLVAENRASEIPEEPPDVTVAPVFEEFLRSGREPMVPRESVEEYLNWLRLSAALGSHLRGRHERAVALLEKTKGSVVFRRRRRLTTWALRVSPAVLRPALGVWLALRRRQAATRSLTR